MKNSENKENKKPENLVKFSGWLGILFELEKKELNNESRCRMRKNVTSSS